jgi:hypothetical protein
MTREYYGSSIATFLSTEPLIVLGQLTKNNEFTLEQTQRDAWLVQIGVLRKSIRGLEGFIHFEYSIPRMGKRIDVVLVTRKVVFVLEFKVGQYLFLPADIDQVIDYALDLKNFHEPSHNAFIAPILIATEAVKIPSPSAIKFQGDKVIFPQMTNSSQLGELIQRVINTCDDSSEIVASTWGTGSYSPTPTIIEAAMALYNGHSVEDISRKDASAINLKDTSEIISEIINNSRKNGEKSICFVTGVPGAGKTLVGLNIANQHLDSKNDLYSVFLSGNGPLVDVLREALARDKVRYESQRGRKKKIGDSRREVKAFIQNVHHFRDACLNDEQKPPIEHVALFDEAQRAWNLEQTANFMRRKKGRLNFNISEPDFLISCLDRHKNWAVVVCLVGGGQEINTGEAGISEWIESLNRLYPTWKIYISSQLYDSEYGARNVLENINLQQRVTTNDKLHLSVSMRSFRSERVSLLVKQVLDLEEQEAKETLERVGHKYPIVVTRDIDIAKKWIKTQARGSERYGIVVSSQAIRLKPYAIDVRPEVDPIHWFLDGKEDIRSSFYLEDVATEFQVQGLELDWSCVVWDADFRYSQNGWEHRSFRGDRWNCVKKPERQIYLKNAYRVLLTRARQGMVIVVPPGDENDPTRKAEFYDPTFNYLRTIGFSLL